MDKVYRFPGPFPAFSAKQKSLHRHKLPRLPDRYFLKAKKWREISSTLDFKITRTNSSKTPDLKKKPGNASPKTELFETLLMQTYRQHAVFCKQGEQAVWEQADHPGLHFPGSLEN